MVLTENPQRNVVFAPGAEESLRRLEASPIPNAILRHPTLTPEARAVYMMMLTCMDGAGIYRGTLQDLSLWSGVTVREVRRILERHLIPAGLVEPHRRGVHRVFHCTVYTGDFDEPTQRRWDEQIIYFAQGTFSGLVKIAAHRVSRTAGPLRYYPWR